MKSLVLSALLSLGALAATAATQPIYFNDSPVSGPPNPLIDASIFVNRSTFSVFTTLPYYETANTMRFTNTGSGLMSASPGFRFTFITNQFRWPMTAWHNERTITVGKDLVVQATNLIHSGRLDAPAAGNVRLDGRWVNLARGAIRVADPLNQTSGGGFIINQTNYVNDAQVSDRYWGAGKNNAVITNAARPLRLDAPGFNQGALSLPFPRSPLHQVIQRGFFAGFFTNFTSIPNFGGDFSAFVHTNRVNPTSYVVQVVFVATNNVNSPGLTADVRFSDDFNAQGAGGYIAAVKMGATDFDIVEQRLITNSVYFIDSTVNETNVTLFRNVDTNFQTPTGTRRPSTYELTRAVPFEYVFGEPPNAPYQPNLLYDSNYQNATVNIDYAAYSAFVGPTNGTQTTGPTPIFGTRNPTFSDPTNFSGRAEIVSDRANFDQTRIRAENFASITTKDLTSNHLARIDAPFLNYDVGASNGVLTITNVAPPTVRRLGGIVSAWSGAWFNTVTNGAGVPENVRFHVLILDNGLRADQQVVIHDFAAKATNITVSDALRVNRNFTLEAENLTVTPTGALLLPVTARLSATNLIRVKNFTNNGTVQVNLAAHFGQDRPESFDTFINRGTVQAGGILVRTKLFENSGLVFPGTFDAIGGVISIEATTATITNGFFNTDSDLILRGRDLFVQNTVFNIGTTNSVDAFGTPVSARRGGLFLTGTNSLLDGGPTSSNSWFVTAGFEVPIRALSGDLIGTTIHAWAPMFDAPTHIWPSQDRGTDVSGFGNNMALGRLILDGEGNNSFVFRPPPGAGPRALYVDYLDLRGTATNYQTTFSVSPDFTIYFADASVPPDKLDGALGGRLRWVKSFVGPFSSTNIVYPNGQTYTFNAGLARSNDLDSDGDGIVNSQDPTPFFVPDSIVLSIQRAAQSKAVITWNALAGSTNTVEYKTGALANTWLALTNFVTGNTNSRVTAVDTIGGGQRVYRVKVHNRRP